MPKIVDLTSVALSRLSEGAFGKVIEEELARITKDLEDRGGDGKSRKLCIEVEIKPIPNSDGRFIIVPKCAAKLPPQQAYPTEARMNYDGVSRQWNLQFNPNSTVPEQGTVDDELPEGSK